MLDTVRDTESARVLPLMIAPLLELLRSVEVALHKDTVEYQFRRVLLEILNRLPVNEAVRGHVTELFKCLLHVLRNDNEENGVTCCKTMVDLVRNYRPLTEETLKDFMTIFQDAFRNMQGLVDQLLSENSGQLDSNVVLPSIRSFKVLAEMGMVMVIFSQNHRPLIAPTIQATMAPALEVLRLESPAQHSARVDYEAMGGFWAGMAPTIKNPHAYSDFINAQIKV
jgi:transformation/transcription domain-associated protein